MTNENFGCDFLFPLLQSRKISVDYDEQEDVMYINYLGTIKEADDATQIGDYIIRFAQNKVVGITVINALEHIKAKFADMPSLFNDEKLVYA